jgi:hypothetical protein
LTQNHRSGRALGVLLSPVLIGALVLTFTVMQATTRTVRAPGPGGRGGYGDGVYTVRLGDTLGAASNGFTARLTGREAATLAAMSGVVSVTRLPVRATVVPTLSDCDSVTAPTAPDAPTAPSAPESFPSPTPLPAPSPPEKGGVPSTGGDHGAEAPLPGASRSRTGGVAEKENAAKTAASLSDVPRHIHGRSGGKGVRQGSSAPKSPEHG